MRTRERVREMLVPTAEERGIVLVIALLTMALLSLLGATFLALSATETTIASNAVNASRAFSLADAGIEHARRQLRDTNINALLTAGGILFNNQALGGGSYSVTVQNNTTAIGSIPADPGGAVNDTDNTVILTSTGSVGPNAASGRRIRVLVTRQSPFQAAMFADESVYLDGGVETDSYDCTAGYDPANPGSYGDVGSNGDIQLENSVTVNGDAMAGGSIDLNGGTVTGSQTPGAPPVILPPVDASYTEPNANGTIGCPPTTPNCYDSTTHDLVTTNSNETVTLNPGTYYFNNISFDKMATLNVTGEVKIYVTGTIYSDSTGSGSAWNPSGPASNLIIFSSYASTDPLDYGINIDQASLFQGGIYAPSAAIYVDAQNGIFGALVGRWVNTDANSEFHYDECLALLDTGLTGLKFVQRPGTWHEVIQ